MPPNIANPDKTIRGIVRARAGMPIIDIAQRTVAVIEKARPEPPMPMSEKGSNTKITS
jgi:hypothetical protein